MYRPQTNVVTRPVAGTNGTGISLVGHHEILIPLIAAAVIEARSEAEAAGTQRLRACARCLRPEALSLLESEIRAGVAQPVRARVS